MTVFSFFGCHDRCLAVLLPVWEPGRLVPEGAFGKLKMPRSREKSFSWEKLRVIDSEFDALSRNDTRFAWEFLQTLPKKIIVFWYHFLSALKTGPLGSYVTFIYVPPFLDYCTPPARTTGYQNCQQSPHLPHPNRLRCRGNSG